MTSLHGSRTLINHYLRDGFRAVRPPTRASRVLGGRRGFSARSDRMFLNPYLHCGCVVTSVRRAGCPEDGLAPFVEFGDGHDTSTGMRG